MVAWRHGRGRVFRLLTVGDDQCIKLLELSLLVQGHGVLVKGDGCEVSCAGLV